jgi:hypothetical protein
VDIDLFALEFFASPQAWIGPGKVRSVVRSGGSIWWFDLVMKAF